MAWLVDTSVLARLANCGDARNPDADRADVELHRGSIGHLSGESAETDTVCGDEFAMNGTHVYLLWHVHEFASGEDDEKLIGAYATEQDAEAAKQRALPLPGFCDCPEGFLIACYQLGQDHWTEGYVTVTPDMFPDELQDD